MAWSETNKFEYLYRVVNARTLKEYLALFPMDMSSPLALTE
jgi:hypothetical protein